MKRIFVAAALVACALSGLLGLTAGINLNPESTVRFVPSWGSVGDWVSGIGALLAVAVALWQIHRQQEREKPKVLIDQHFEKNNLSLTLVSDGIVPATVMGAYMIYSNGTMSLDISDLAPEKTSYPQRLDRGEAMTLLDTNSFGFSMLGKSLISPAIRDLQSKGTRSAIYGEGINQAYFDQLNLIESHGAKLRVKTAQTVEDFDLSTVAFSALLKNAIDDEHNQAREQIERWRAEARELFSIIEASIEKAPPDSDAST